MDYSVVEMLRKVSLRRLKKTGLFARGSTGKGGVERKSLASDQIPCFEASAEITCRSKIRHRLGDSDLTDLFSGLS